MFFNLCVGSIPKTLRETLGDHASEDLCDLIKEIDLDARKDALALAEERLEKKLAIEIGKVGEKISSLESRFSEKISSFEVGFNGKISSLREDIIFLKGETKLIKAELRFLIILTIIAITLMNPVAAEIIKRLLKL
ncbi:MAG: hypothetical protein HZA01_01145 [Nitrospinae bacterium]|nr:hypothetical protein [Nitrospinota bacterium]